MNIYVDVDGVLVTTPFRERAPNQLVANPRCVANLNVVTRTTGANFILSSAWRFCGLREMKQIFGLWGVHGEILDITPDLSPAPRWKEIEATWRPGPFVILDDELDMGPPAKHHVLTQYFTGLTAELAADCIRRLTSPPPPTKL